VANDLDTRLEDLHEKLGELPAREYVPWQVAQVFNALLAAAKKADSDDPVIASLQPVEPSMLGPVANVDCRTMRTTTEILRNALVERG
jgi:hypothetical protein